MEITRINEILSDLDNLISRKDIKRIRQDKPENYGEEQYDHTELDKVEIFDISDNEYFLKVITTIDSYGEKERISSIQFVKPVKKEVIVYE